MNKMDKSIIDMIMQGGSPSVSVTMSSSDLNTLVREVAAESSSRAAEKTADAIMTIMGDKTKYCDREEAAGILGVSTATLPNMEKRGDLTPIRIGVKVSYLRAEVVALRENKR